MRISATDLNKRPGSYLNRALKEPVVIEKAGLPTVVMVSYERFMELEDVYWGELAIDADREKSLGVKKTRDFLLSDD